MAELDDPGDAEALKAAINAQRDALWGEEEEVGNYIDFYGLTPGEPEGRYVGVKGARCA